MATLPDKTEAEIAAATKDPFGTGAEESKQPAGAAVAGLGSGDDLEFLSDAPKSAAAASDPFSGGGLPAPSMPSFPAPTPV